MQPISRRTIQVELEILAHDKFTQWDPALNGRAEAFWLLVTDADCEQILHAEYFTLHEQQARMKVEQHVSFMVPLFDPLHPQYFVKLLSDRWLQSEHTIPISFRNLVLPDKYAAPT